VEDVDTVFENSTFGVIIVWSGQYFACGRVGTRHTQLTFLSEILDPVRLLNRYFEAWDQYT